LLLGYWDLFSVAALPDRGVRPQRLHGPARKTLHFVLIVATAYHTFEAAAYWDWRGRLQRGRRRTKRSGR